MTKLPLDINNWFKSLASSIEALHRNQFQNKQAPPLDEALDRLLVTNFTLWGYEDEARRKDVPDKTIAGLKRNIDKNNQKRHDTIRTVDEILQKDIDCSIGAQNINLPMNSETPGSIFDRLMVLALRAYHLTKETERRDADKPHIERCAGMLQEVKSRSGGLLKCMEELLSDYYSGKKRLKSYNEHKLYNDPSLNPSLRKTKPDNLRGCA